MDMQICCQLIKYSRFEGSVLLSLIVIPSANGACESEKSRCSAFHFKAFLATKYAIYQSLLFMSQVMYSVIYFFIISSNVDILLLYVKNRCAVLPLHCRVTAFQKRQSDLCVHCGVCQNNSGGSLRKISYMIDAMCCKKLQYMERQGEL